MTKNGMLSEFVRDAIREKATRELTMLNQQTDAFAGVERARDTLYGLSTDLTTSAPAITAIAGETAVGAKLKKLRKLVEDAHALATEIGDALGVDARREAVNTSRQSILDALRTAGIDPDAVIASTPESKQ